MPYSESVPVGCGHCDGLCCIIYARAVSSSIDVKNLIGFKPGKKGTMYTFLLILFIPTCLALIAIVLLQVGKGAGFAGAFGAGGGGQTIFGARAGTFLTKLTAWLAALFIVLALAMAVLSARAKPGSGLAPAPVEEPEQAPGQSE